MIVTKGLGSSRMVTLGLGSTFDYAEAVPVVNNGVSGGGGAVASWQRLGYVPWRDRSSDYVVMSRRPRRGKGPLKGFDILSEIADEDAADEGASADLSLFSDVEQTRPKTQDWWMQPWPAAPVDDHSLFPDVKPFESSTEAMMIVVPRPVQEATVRPVQGIAARPARGADLAQATGGMVQEKKGWSTGTKIAVAIGIGGLCTAAGYLLVRHLRAKARRIEAKETCLGLVSEPIEPHRRGGRKAGRGHGCRAGRACLAGVGRVR